MAGPRMVESVGVRKATVVAGPGPGPGAYATAPRWGAGGGVSMRQDVADRKAIETYRAVKMPSPGPGQYRLPGPSGGGVSMAGGRREEELDGRAPGPSSYDPQEQDRAEVRSTAFGETASLFALLRDKPRESLELRRALRPTGDIVPPNYF